MPRKKKKKKDKKSQFAKLNESLNEETKHAVLSVIFFVFSVFFILSKFNYAGIIGDFTYKYLHSALGAGFWVLPIATFILSYSFFRSKQPNIITTNFIGGLLFILSTLGIIDIFFEGSGGYIGGGVGYVFEHFLGAVAGSIFLIAILIISVLIIFNTHFKFFSREEKSEEDEEEDEEEIEEYEGGSIITPDEDEGEYDDNIDAEEENESDQDDIKTNKGDETLDDEESNGGGIFSTKFTRQSGEHTLPPLSLLEKDSGKPGAGDIKANANIIKRTLANFGITIEIDEVSIGPSITRYAIKPAEGVRLSRIVALQNDLALALAAHPVRIEAPIPGKSLVGIEIPNSKKSTVGLATLLSSKEFQEKEDPLIVALGKTVTGTPMFANIAKAPHVLIAGATGSGKSVTIHALISSLLFRNTPQELRFIMIDPKRVELTLYNGIPHLATPVITDPKKAILSLKWAIKEMERRYNILETEQVRDISTYHRNVIEPALQSKNISEENLPEPMPYIVIVVDELADIMATYPKELEAAIVRLAQMSRAVGIHLILSTQRPSVNVITGLIKANIPMRIALQVSSQIDSRTIIDSAGAEKLLGAGDMLYMSGEMSKPIRLQSAFVTEREVKKVVKFLKKEYEDELQDSLDLSEVDKKNNLLNIDLEHAEKEDVEDDLYNDAKSIVLESGKASTSYLQRRLGIGYSRAARIIDMLEERGIVGPQQGSKPREVLYGANEGEEETEEYYG